MNSEFDEQPITSGSENNFKKHDRKFLNKLKISPQANDKFKYTEDMVFKTNKDASFNNKNEKPHYFPLARYDFNELTIESVIKLITKADYKDEEIIHFIYSSYKKPYKSITDQKLRNQIKAYKELANYINKCSIAERKDWKKCISKTKYSLPYTLRGWSLIFGRNIQKNLCKNVKLTFVTRIKNRQRKSIRNKLNRFDKNLIFKDSMNVDKNHNASLDFQVSNPKSKLLVFKRHIMKKNYVLAKYKQKIKALRIMIKSRKAIGKCKSNSKRICNLKSHAQFSTLLNEKNNLKNKRAAKELSENFDEKNVNKIESVLNYKSYISDIDYSYLLDKKSEYNCKFIYFAFNKMINNMNHNNLEKRPKVIIDHIESKEVLGEFKFVTNNSQEEDIDNERSAIMHSNGVLCQENKIHCYSKDWFNLKSELKIIFTSVLNKNLIDENSFNNFHYVIENCYKLIVEIDNLLHKKELQLNSKKKIIVGLQVDLYNTEYALKMELDTKDNLMNQIQNLQSILEKNYGELNISWNKYMDLNIKQCTKKNHDINMQKNKQKFIENNFIEKNKEASINLSDEIVILKEKLRKSEETICQLQKIIEVEKTKHCNEDIDSLKKHINKLEMDLLIKEENLKKSNYQDNLNEKINSLTKHLEELKVSLIKKEEKLKNNKQFISKLEKNIEFEKEQYVKNIKNCNEEIDYLNKYVEKLENNLVQKQEELKNSEDLINKLNENIKNEKVTYVKNTKAINEQIFDLQNSIDKLNVDIMKKEEQLKNNEHLINKLEENNNFTKEQSVHNTNKSNQEIHNLKNHIEKLEIDLVKKQEELAKFLKVISSVTDSLTELRNNIDLKGKFNLFENSSLEEEINIIRNSKDEINEIKNCYSHNLKIMRIKKNQVSKLIGRLQKTEKLKKNCIKNNRLLKKKLLALNDGVISIKNEIQLLQKTYACNSNSSIVNICDCCSTFKGFTSQDNIDFKFRSGSLNIDNPLQIKFTQELVQKNELLTLKLKEEEEIKEELYLEINKLKDKMNECNALIEQEYSESSRQFDLQLAMHLATAERYREQMKRIEDHLNGN